MSYLPHTNDDRDAMLAAIGVDKLEDLFCDIPKAARFPALDLPAPCSELEIGAEMRALCARNADSLHHDSFLGAGIYSHFVPAIVDHVLRRAEFYTSYTPYQPEASQGMLQAMFEYQSMICQLTCMEVSNASHYDGATSLAEAVLLALDQTDGHRSKILCSPGVHPQYRDVMRTYLKGTDARVVGDKNGVPGMGDLQALLDADTAAFVIQSPDFFGQIETLDGLADAVHAAGALLIVVTDPIMLGLFNPPGALGADVVVADGQPLGLPPSFGGPHVGIFATRRAHVRRLVGRLVGETTDSAGERAYALTLATREQHIRRARATSNICTNAALGALGAAVYLAAMGKSGVRQAAELCYQKSHYAAGEIGKIAGLTINPQAPDKPFFKEFVVGLPMTAAEMNAILWQRHGIIGGYDLGRDWPDLKNHLLIAVTEVSTRASIDRLVTALRNATNKPHGS